jgi:hypothetical protein
MTTIHGHTSAEPTSRRPALGLLAALALTLGAVAAPLLAATAHADGPPAGPVTPTGTSKPGVINAGSTVSPTGGSKPGTGGTIGTVSPTGTSKPGVSVGSD